MSTERVIHLTGLARPAATQIAASVARQSAARAGVDIRHMGAEDTIARAVARSTVTESYPYSSFEQGGVRRFERSPFARGPFDSRPDLRPFRIS
jgi:hypothetical protein